MFPKVGLALGSGAARGWAHIGIIEALEELGIKIDVVAGCSIGAYVGSCYAAGRMQHLKEWLVEFNEWQIASLMGVGLTKGGLVSGDRVFQKLQEDLTLANIEDLNIPFGAVATDMQRGTEVKYTSGSTVEAVRASCSIPGDLPPHWYQKTWLIDGAVVNPVPVSLCRSLGADVVIAVNLSSDFSACNSDQHQQEQQAADDRFSLFMEKSRETVSQWWEAAFPAVEKSAEEDDKPKSIPSMFNVVSNALDIMQDRVTRSRLAGDPPDILLSPRLGHIGIMEFHRGEEAMDIGRENVARMAAQIQYQLQC